MQENNIMSFEPVLPADFDGVFRFSNPFDEDFIGIWAKKEYLFPAGTMTPIVIPEHSPIEIQHIRKKFARDLAEREWYISKGYKVLRGQEGTPGNRTMNSIHQAATYTLKDLEPYIQMCLKPLPEGKITSRPHPTKDIVDDLKRDDDGNFVSEVVDPKKDSLKKRALEA